MISRGTTPTHTFELPFDASLIRNLWIIYAQNGVEILKKEKAHCTLSGNTITAKLTQKETLLFNPARRAQIQVRLLLNDGNAPASNIIEVPVSNSLSEEVIV